MGDRMELDEVQPAAGTEQLGDDAGPRVDVREPAERADPGVDAVERSTTESGRRVVHVGHLELGVEARPRRQLAGREDRRLAQVDADDAGAEAGPAEGVHAEVALEVDEVEAGDVAGLLDLVRTKWRATCQKAVDAVEVGVDVDGDALVPPGAVELEPGVVHVGHGPVRATTASSTGGTFGGRCWRGLGGREQPSLLRTLRASGSRRNDDLRCWTICPTYIRSRRAISPVDSRSSLSRSSIGTRSCAIESRSRRVTARSSRLSKSTVTQ